MDINFHNNEIPKEGSEFNCVSVIFIDSGFWIGKNYYPQVFLEECKYVVEDKKIPKCITDDIDISSESNEETSHEEN